MISSVFETEFAGESLSSRGENVRACRRFCLVRYGNGGPLQRDGF
ncbi:MAG: hypothetical protein ACLSAP_05670 [Oscillospiraceae bacterium]